VSLFEPEPRPHRRDEERPDVTQPLYPPPRAYPADEQPPGSLVRRAPQPDDSQPLQYPPQRYAPPQIPERELFTPASPRAVPGGRLPERVPDPYERALGERRTERAEMRATRESTTRIALIYPELLGTYGDGGNATVLTQRLRWRGLAAETVSVPAGEPVPTGCDIYLLGGGEDEPQTLAAEGLRRNNAIGRAVAGGAVVLAVCAGYQVIGESFPAGGRIHEGLALIGVETRRSFDPPDAQLPPRVVGDIAIDPDPSLGLPTILGYENHGGRTRALPGVRGFPFGRVLRGVGNGVPEGTDGHVDGRVIGTYLHGPVLAQNPALADLLLTMVHGSLPRLPGPPEVDALRTARLRALQVR
jgi:CobQ-like glutamine amidotransferase family enzyme